MKGENSGHQYIDFEMFLFTSILTPLCNRWCYMFFMRRLLNIYNSMVIMILVLASSVKSNFYWPDGKSFWTWIFAEVVSIWSCCWLNFLPGISCLNSSIIWGNLILSLKVYKGIKFPFWNFISLKIVDKQWHVCTHFKSHDPVLV